MVTINGIDRVIASLERLATVGASGVQRDLITIAQGIRVSAANKCPVRTGQLRSSIRVEISPNVVTIVAGGDGVEYALYVEYGTSRQYAQPFMRPAVDEYIDRIEQTIKQTLERLIY